jgi:REP-associated tyrosine transposase
MVVEAIKFGESSLKLYQLVAYVVLANHVHALWIPYVPLSKITHTIKSYTGLKANQMLGRKEKRFWQDESFDHWVRSDATLSKILSVRVSWRELGIGRGQVPLVERRESFLN